MIALERTTYRGYMLVVTEFVILVSDPDGNPVGDAKSMSSARRMVQRHRNATLGGRS